MGTPCLLSTLRLKTGFSYMTAKYTLSHIDLAHDIDDIVGIHRADIGDCRPEQDTPNQWYKMGGPWMERSLARSYFSDLLANSSDVYVIRANGIAISEVEIEPIDADTVFLSQLIVHPDHRGKGIGKQIMCLLNGELQRRGIRQIVTCPEKDAEGFYAKLGYRHWKHRALIESDNSFPPSDVPPHSWRESSPPSTDTPMILGHNQPPRHHTIHFSMNYFALLDAAPHKIRFFETCHNGTDRIIVGLYDTGPAPDDKVWLFAWGQIPFKTAFFLAVECAQIHSSRGWFTYCSPEEAQALSIKPDAEEPWWIGTPVGMMAQSLRSS